MKTLDLVKVAQVVCFALVLLKCSVGSSEGCPIMRVAIVPQESTAVGTEQL